MAELRNIMDIPPMRFGHSVTQISQTQFIMYGGGQGNANNYKLITEVWMYNIVNYQWTKMLNSGKSEPPPRLAHAAEYIGHNQIVVSGGLIYQNNANSMMIANKNSNIYNNTQQQLAADINNDMYILTIEPQTRSYSWGLMETVGQRPIGRFGHSLTFLSPYLVFFAGHDGTTMKNDFWRMNLSRFPVVWTPMTWKGIQEPIPRYYHSVALWKHRGEEKGIIIFGGKTGENSSINDLWLVQRDNRTTHWNINPISTKSVEKLTGRFHHRIQIFQEQFIVIHGGRPDYVLIDPYIQIYDMENDQVYRDTVQSVPVKHCTISISDQFLYCVGGLDLTIEETGKEHIKMVTVDIKKLLHSMIFKSKIVQQPSIEDFREKEKSNNFGKDQIIVGTGQILNREKLEEKDAISKYAEINNQIDQIRSGIQQSQLNQVENQIKYNPENLNYLNQPNSNNTNLSNNLNNNNNNLNNNTNNNVKSDQFSNFSITAPLTNNYTSNYQPNKSKLNTLPTNTSVQSQPTQQLPSRDNTPSRISKLVSETPRQQKLGQESEAAVSNYHQNTRSSVSPMPTRHSEINSSDIKSMSNIIMNKGTNLDSNYAESPDILQSKAKPRPNSETLIDSNDKTSLNLQNYEVRKTLFQPNQPPSSATSLSQQQAPTNTSSISNFSNFLSNNNYSPPQIDKSEPIQISNNNMFIPGLGFVSNDINPKMSNHYYDQEPQQSPRSQKRKDPASAHNILLDLMLIPQKYKNEEIQFLPSQDIIIDIINQAMDIFKSESTVLKVRTPVKVFGDIHGQYTDLMRHFDYWGSPYADGADQDIDAWDYIFLGDFVDRGKFSLETMILLLSLKIRFPKQVHLIRGNHEDQSTNLMYGFSQECAHKLKEDILAEGSIFKKFARLFEWLPLAAIIDDKYLCLHAGVGKHLESLEQIQNLQRPLEVRILNPETQQEKIVIDILWSDPSYQTDGITENQNRGEKIFRYGNDVLQRFLRNNNLKKLIRAHEVFQEGYDLFCDGKGITVFSATDYCGVFKNSGAILIVQKDLEIIPQKITPNNTLKAWQEELIEKYPPTPISKKRFL